MAGDEPRFFVSVPVPGPGSGLLCCCAEITDEAPSTEPPHETRMSSRNSWDLSGQTDRRRANFISVDPSSGVSGGDRGGALFGASRGLFLKTKASI